MNVRNWVLRYIKFNLIGSTVFGVATLIYWLTFPMFAIWTWIVANSFGGILQFSLTAYFNKKQKGRMFDS